MLVASLVSHLSVVVQLCLLIWKINENKIKRKINIDLAVVASQSSKRWFITFRVFIKSLKIYPDYLQGFLIIDFRERWSFPQVSQLINQ